MLPLAVTVGVGVEASRAEGVAGVYVYTFSASPEVDGVELHPAELAGNACGLEAVAWAVPAIAGNGMRQPVWQGPSSEFT